MKYDSTQDNLGEGKTQKKGKNNECAHLSLHYIPYTSNKDY